MCSKFVLINEKSGEIYFPCTNEEGKIEKYLTEKEISERKNGTFI